MANSVDGGGMEVAGATRRGKWARPLSALLFLATLSLPQEADAGTPFFASSAVVKELTPDDWPMVLGSKHAWFVDFYADWCPHCLHFAPIWERVATAFRGDSRVAFAAVDCALHTAFCGTLQVGGFPTLRSFNIPGVDDSFQKTGAYVHEGEYHVDEQNDLMMLLRGKLQAVGPDPKGGLAVALPGSSSVSQYPKPEEPEASQHTATMRFNDALVALTYALHQGTALAAADTKSNFFKSSLQDNDLSLGGDKLVELVEWLSFLSVVLPSAEAKQRLGELASVARQAQGQAGQLPRSVWIQAVEARGIDVAPVEAGSDPSPHFKICTTYTCGLWTLFHLITVSAAETDSSVGAAWCADGKQGGQTQALERIRGFVANFFGCEDCKKHFLSMYDGCQLGRCQLACLDGRGAARWLWQVHNNVTLRVAGEQGLPIPAQWPPKPMCPNCWARDGRSGDADNDMMVFRYLVQAYTPAADVEGELSSFSGAQSLWRRGRVAQLWSIPVVRLACFLALAAVLIGLLCWWNAARNDRSPSAIAQRNRGRPHYLRTQEEQIMDQNVCGYSRSMHVLHPNSIVMTM